MMTDTHSNILQKTKTYLRSTLLSHKGSIPTTQLNHDYRELVGDFIPYSKLQFSDLDSFLSTIPDVCHVQWEGGQMVVVGVAGKKSAHIKDMVARQKNVSGKRSRGYGGGGFRSGGGGTGYRYQNYNVNISDDSDWEKHYIKNSSGERAKMCDTEISKAVPAGYEDTDDEDDMFGYSCGQSKPSSSVTKMDDGAKQTTGKSHIPPPPIESKKTNLHSQSPSLFHYGPLPPSPLSSPPTFIDLTVCQATSPNQFSVQSLNSKEHYHLLTVQMKKHYTTSNSHKVPSHILVAGSVVAARYRDSWYRAKVVRCLWSHFLVSLKLVDTGKMILCTTIEDIQPLWSKFAQLPIQAVSARLAGVSPASGNEAWWVVETDWFRETVLGKFWVGVVEKVEEGEHGQAVLVMKLYDTSTDEDIEVSEEMLGLGLAKME